MMNKQELNEAFSKLHASDDLLRDVLTQEKKSSLFSGINVRRVIACTAVFVLLIGLVLYKDRTSQRLPLISVIVYADDTEGVELHLPEKNSAFSNVTDDDIYSSGPTSDGMEEGRFFCRISLNEYEKQYTHKRVFQDGEELTKLNTKELTVATSWVAPAVDSEQQFAQTTETTILGYTDTKTEIEIHYLKENGDLLLKCVISVTPQEEGFLIVLEEVYIPEA